MPRIVGTGIAVPRHRHAQAKLLKIFRPHFGGLLNDRRAGMFGRSGVNARYSVEPLRFYFGRDFDRCKNAAFLKHGLILAERAVRGCLKAAGADFSRVTHVFSATTTGLLTPSLEAHLAQKLPFPRSVKRTPLFGAGCAGGVVALARACEYLRGHPEEAALVVSVELCSLTFLPQERTMTQWVAASLFGDGAAAVLMAGDAWRPRRRGAEILGAASHLFPNSTDVMGWDFSTGDMRLVLSPGVLSLVRGDLAPVVRSFLGRHGARLEDVEYFLLHPGSGKIIDAYEESLGLKRRDTRLTRRFLSNFGNLSSSSILFILHDALTREKPRAGARGLVAAMGPGFAAEMALLRF